MKAIGTLLLAALLASCAQLGRSGPTVTPQPTPKATDTPVEAFKQLVTSHPPGVTTSPTAPPTVSQYQREICDQWLGSSISYDVEETNSLVTPLIGTVEYTLTKTFTNQFGTWQGTLIVTVTYGWQDGGWVQKSAETQIDIPGAAENNRFAAYCVVQA